MAWFGAIVGAAFALGLLVPSRVFAQQPRGRVGERTRSGAASVGDSASAVKVASASLRQAGGGKTFRVTVFSAVDGGYVVKLQPEPVMPGVEVCSGSMPMEP